MPDPEDPGRQSSRNGRRFIQFSGMAIEMGALIFVGAWLGRQMDDWLRLPKPVFLLIGTLLFTLAAIWRVIHSLK